MAVVGSMEVIGLFRDMGLFINMKKIQAEMRSAASAVKETSTEMVRATRNAGLLGKVMGLVGIGGFAALLTTMPRVNAELGIAHTWMELIGLEMDDNLAPAAELLSGALEKVYLWFSGLTEGQQDIIIWAGIAAMGLMSIGAAAGMTGLALKGLGLSGVIGWLGTFAGKIGAAVAGSLALQVGIGLLVGFLGVLALDKAGVLDWISNLGEHFRERANDGDTLYQVLELMLLPLATIGELVLALLGIKGWDTFHANIRKAKDLIGELADKYLSLQKSMGTGVWNAIMPEKYEIHDTGGMAGYTGMHWLKAGETVNTVGTGSGGGGTTIQINNNFGDVSLQNGMDWDEFLDKSSQGQADKLAWMATR